MSIGFSVLVMWLKGELREYIYNVFEILVMKTNIEIL